MRARKAEIIRIYKEDELADPLDIYSEKTLDDQHENEAISPEEQGFMMGYLAAGG